MYDYQQFSYLTNSNNSSIKSPKYTFLECLNTLYKKLNLEI